MRETKRAIHRIRWIFTFCPRATFISCEWSLELLHLLLLCVCNSQVFTKFIVRFFFACFFCFVFAVPLISVLCPFRCHACPFLCAFVFSWFMFGKSICRIVEQKPASGLPLVLLFIIICVIVIALPSSFSQSLLHIFASLLCCALALSSHSYTLSLCPFVIWFCLAGCQIFFVVICVVSFILLHLFLYAMWFRFIKYLSEQFEINHRCIVVLKIIKNVLRVLLWFALIRFDFTMFLIAPALMCVFVHVCVRVKIILYYIHSVSLFHALIFIINISTDCWDWIDVVLRGRRMRSSQCCCRCCAACSFNFVFFVLSNSFSSAIYFLTFKLNSYHTPFAFCLSIHNLLADFFWSLLLLLLRGNQTVWFFVNSFSLWDHSLSPLLLVSHRKYFRFY